jgi:hypothetical protein
MLKLHSDFHVDETINDIRVSILIFTHCAFNLLSKQSYLCNFIVCVFLLFILILIKLLTKRLLLD